MKIFTLATLGLVVVVLEAPSLVGQPSTTIECNQRMTLSYENDQVYAWGTALDGTAATPLRPTPVSLPAVPTAMSAGAGFALFLMPGGEVWSAGENTFGQLGTGSAGGPRSVAPAVVVPLSVGIEASVNMAYAWTANGELYGWGAEQFLGAGPGTGTVVAPVRIPIPTPVVDVAADQEFSLAIDDQGQVWGWGNTAPLFGGLPTPVLIQGLPPAQKAYTSGGAGLVITVGGQVFIVARAAAAPLSLGFAQSIRLLPGISQTRSMAYSTPATAVLDYTGNVSAFANTYSMWGYGAPSTNLNMLVDAPRPVPTLQNITEIAAEHALYARDASGVLWVVGPANSPDGLGLGAIEASVMIPARVSMTGPAPSITIARQQPAQPICHQPLLQQPTLTLPTLGGELVLSFRVGPNGLVFAAPGPAAAPQAVSPTCSLFLDLPAALSWLSAGIGPFSNMSPFGDPSLDHTSRIIIPIPDSPALAGFTLTAQSAWPSQTNPGTVAMGEAYTVVIN